VVTLRVAQLEAVFTALEPLRLPPFIGSTLRGAFGHALKSAVCVMRARECHSCQLSRGCLYTRIFETDPEGADLRHLGVTDNAPRPYVFAPGMGTPEILQPGDTLSLTMRLFGWAVDYSSYVMYALSLLAERGLGAARGRLQLTRIIDGTTGLAAYDCEDGDVYEPIKFVRLPVPIPAAGQGDVTVLWQTPLRVVNSHQLVQEPTAPVVMRTLLRRISGLLTYHEKATLPYNAQEVLAATDRVAMKRNSTNWYDWKRYSNRQNRAVEMGGILGKTTYEDTEGVLRPWLTLAETIHLGKSCTFGLGAVRIVA